MCTCGTDFAAGLRPQTPAVRRTSQADTGRRKLIRAVHVLAVGYGLPPRGTIEGLGVKQLDELRHGITAFTLHGLACGTASIAFKSVMTVSPRCCSALLHGVLHV